MCLSLQCKPEFGFQQPNSVNFLSDWLSDDFNFISKSQQTNGNNELITAFD